MLEKPDYGIRVIEPLFFGARIWKTGASADGAWYGPHRISYYALGCVQAVAETMEDQWDRGSWNPIHEPI